MNKFVIIRWYGLSNSTCNDTRMFTKDLTHHAMYTLSGSFVHSTIGLYKKHICIRMI